MSSSSTESVPEKASVSTESVDTEQQEKYKAACNKYVSNWLTSNRTIQYLIDQLDKMGCTPPEGFIRCMDCGKLAALGAFHLLETSDNSTAEALTANNTATSDPNAKHASGNKKSLGSACSSYVMDTIKKISLSNKSDKEAQDELMKQLNSSNNGTSSVNTTKTPEIFLCQQHLLIEGQAHRVIAHELVHAVDTCRTKMDPQRNCIHLACTEIRAENLSSECNFINELMRIGPHSLRKHGQDCVKRRAVLSVGSHPRCRDRAEEYVDAAMGRCYKDIFPFERHPNEQ
jgi:inner membrane protease ATP23